MFRVKFSREIVLKLLYQIDILELNAEEIQNILGDNLNFFRSLNADEKAFIMNILDHVLKNQDQIDQLISQNLIGWKLKRLAVIDRNLLRMGIAESYFNDQKAIIIDDILRIAKKYGDKDSYKIINAILDKVIT